MAIFAPPLRRTLQDLQVRETRVIGDGSRVRVSGTGVGLGIWQTWTPTYANFTIGNGTVVSRYVQIGKEITVYFEWTLGSTSAVGTGGTISTPVTAASTYTATDNTLGTCRLFDDNLTVEAHGYIRLETTTTFRPIVYTAGGTYAAGAAVTATVPHTWTTSDKFSFTVRYEAA